MLVRAWAQVKRSLAQVKRLRKVMCCLPLDAMVITPINATTGTKSAGVSPFDLADPLDDGVLRRVLTPTAALHGKEWGD